MVVPQTNYISGLLISFVLVIAGGCKKISSEFVSVATPPSAELRAMAFLNEEQWEEAIVEFRKVVKSSPENGDAWLNLGYCLMHVEKQDEAMRALVEAAKFENSRALANYNIACIHSLSKDADKAFEFLKKAIELGFSDYEFMTNDSDFDFIRLDPRYKEVTASLARESEEFEELMD